MHRRETLTAWGKGNWRPSGPEGCVGSGDVWTVRELSVGLRGHTWAMADGMTRIHSLFLFRVKRWASQNTIPFLITEVAYGNCEKKILKDREGFAKMRELYIHFLGLSFRALFYVFFLKKKIKHTVIGLYIQFPVLPLFTEYLSLWHVILQEPVFPWLPSTLWRALQFFFDPVSLLTNAKRWKPWLSGKKRWIP